uniref:Protein ROS1 n=1 Tax=Arundo donax TaxID=35708 RepID=A0A0A9FJQ7_ARUDO
MQDFGQWLPQSHKTGSLCFTSTLVPSQIDTSIEMQTRTCALVSAEKESALFGNTNGVGPIEGIRNDAGSIVGNGNDTGSTEEGIDLNKTPALKSKRKKHRPKVLKEEKPSKTPKSATPNSSKGKEGKTPGKRKYVRKQTPAVQPRPEQAPDSNCRAEPKPVRRCLNFDGQYNKEGVHPVTQAQVTEVSVDPKDYQPPVSSVNQRNAQTQPACHAGSSTSSIYSSPNQMANAQLLPADNMQKRVLIDLNSCINQMQNEYTNFVNCHAQDFQSGIRETIETNPMLELRAGMPHKNVLDLNSSISLLQSMSTNFAEYLLSSPQASLRQTQMANQMLNGHGMPENPITQTQCFERPCSRNAVITDQLLNSYILTNNHNPPANLNKLDTTDDDLRINTSSYRYTGEALRSHNSHDSHIHSMNTRREHNASNGAQTASSMHFNHQNNGLAPVNAYNAATSEAPYFPETYKRKRLDNHDYRLDAVVNNCSTSSAYLSSNQNANLVSAIHSNVLTLADAQRLIACEKSRASQRMISFGSAQDSVAKRAEIVQQYNRPTLPGTAYRDCIEVSDKQFRVITQEFTQLPDSPNTLQRENVIARFGSHQLQSLGGNMVSGSDLPAELHKCNIYPQDDIQNRVCIAPHIEAGRSISGEHFRSPVTRTTLSTNNGTLRTEGHQMETSVDVIRAPTNPINPSTSNDALRIENNQLEVSPETFVVKPCEKRKVRGRPRKELKPGEKPKPRGRPRKEKVVHAVLMSKGSHTDPLQNVDISCVRAVNSERVVESISSTTASWTDPLDLIIQKIALLDINKSYNFGAAEPHGALVPYKGEIGAIVPFEGNVKRKRSRAKVDLDPVTTLMWKLLMGPDMSDGAEVMDKDKEKWLEEERKIFQGRVDSFIARMHLVQGDRRFSPWKGSVVDSVVGVFLTQNVSDHLSSSAFMALAAKFPVKPEVSQKPAPRVFHTNSEENGCCAHFFW